MRASDMTINGGSSGNDDDDSNNESTQAYTLHKSRLQSLQSAEWLSISSLSTTNSSQISADSIARIVHKCKHASPIPVKRRHPQASKFGHLIWKKFGRRSKSEREVSENFVSLFEATTSVNMLVIFVIILGLTIGSSFASPESPAKLQRSRVQQLQQQPSISNNTNYNNSTFDSSSRTDRVRRTNYQQAGNTNRQECPSLSRIASLVPSESHAQACCDCSADHLGWHITCFAESRHSDCVPLNAPASSRNQQQQPASRRLAPSAEPLASGAASRRLYRRSPARWMGDEVTIGSSQSPNSSSPLLSNANDSPMRYVDETAHEGFGEDIPGPASPVEATTRPQSAATANEQQQGASNKRRPPSMIMTRGDSSIGVSSSNNNSNNNSNSNSGNNASSSLTSGGEDGIIPQPSSSSITLMQLQKQTDSTSQHQQVPSGGARTRLAQQATSGSNIDNNNNNDNHPMFPTVPVLFSITYTRNNIIVIDCDQAAPYYKPAMFQGFNVNEISSFTFNNCQLPKITFSAILLRTGAPQSLVQVDANAASGAGRSSNSQSLKPNQRPRNHHNLVRRQVDDQASLVASGATLEARESGLASRFSALSSSGAMKNEPKVKSLTLNLHTMVEQRTLIYLLTGLNLLEELELNYVQLNLTNYELDDLTADPTTPLPTSSTTTSAMSTASAEASANLAQPSLQTAMRQQVTTIGASHSPSSLTATVNPLIGSATSTTAAPNNQQMLLVATSAAGSAASSPVARTLIASTTSQNAQSTAIRAPPTTTQAPFSSSLSQSQSQQHQLPSMGSSSNSATTTTTTTTTTTSSPTTSSTTTTTTTSAPSSTTTTLKPQTTNSISSGRPRSPQVNLLRPVSRATSLGSPRGLLSSGGIPTTTLATTTTSLPSVGHAQGPAGSATTNGPAAATTQQQQQLRHNQSSASRMNNQTTLPANLISVAASQSVSYTSQTATAGNTAQTVHQRGQPAMTTTGNNQPPASSSILLTQPSQHPQHQQHQTVPTTRLHQAPSPWFQPTTASTNNGATGFQTQTPPVTSQTSGADQSILNGPINTPYASSLHTNGFGIRTSPASSASLPMSLALYNSNSPGAFRSQTTTPTAATTNRQQMQTAGLRSLQQQTAATTSTQSSNTNPQQPMAAESTLQFQMAVGGRHSLASGNRRQFQQQPQVVTLTTSQQQQAPINQRPTHSIDSAGDTLDQLASSGASPTFASLTDAVSPSASMASRSAGDETTSEVNHYGRFKRYAAARSLDEFELSFGELLPNLKSLKLVGFIDLPKAVGGDHTQANRFGAGPNAGGGSRQRPQQQQVRPARVRRQFQPSDVPERDEGHMSDSESEAIASAAGDSLLAEETSVHHNSVMASDSIVSRSTTHNHRLSTSPAPQQSSHQQDSSTFLDGSTDHDGWQAAGSSSIGGGDSTSSPSQLTPSFASHQPAESNTGANGMQMDESNEHPNQQQQQQHQSFGRVKRLSLVLVKMFSKLSKLRVLHLRSNDIPYWPDRVLHDSRHSLTLLYLMSNNIRQLGRYSFANLTELEALDLSANQLRQLSSEQFRDLVKLTDLRARRNLFRKFPISVLARWSAAGTGAQSQQQQRSQLAKVDFSQNRYLTNLAPIEHANSKQQQQHQLVPVESLNLADCSLNDQLAGKSPEWLFSALPEMVNLSLQRNKLRELLQVSNLFGKNSKLKELDISHNQLTSLSPSLFNGNASQIVELYLSHNQLTQIPEQFLFNLRRLRKLSLSHNKLNQLNANLFLTNQLLESLDLSHNQLVTLNTQHSGRIPFGNGANLRYLSLAHNNLSNFELDLNRVEWIFYPHLQVLDLSHNKFQGQIPMPIFHLVAAEMLLNLSSNSIQSVNVDAQAQREHWDRYATYEAPPSPLATDQPPAQSQQQTKVPTVDIRLTGNPISCDCLLEPLISYSRRVALATNPTLVATIFPAASSQSSAQRNLIGQAAHQADSSLPSDSRYSVLSGNNPNKPNLDEHQSSGDANARQPQVFYQFKLTDVYCAQPNDLQHQLLSHINIGDLLCPIKDERLCPRQCQCYYQSAFKTAIVDCSNKQLTRVPEQLTDASNFVHFGIESSIYSQQQQLQEQRPSASADTLIIRLDNNKLTSMERLSKLFTITKSPLQTDQSSGGRFARAPAQRTLLQASTAAASESPDDESMLAAKANELISDDDLERPLEPLARASAQPLSSSAPAPAAGGRRSPVAVGRGMLGAGNALSQSRRSRRNIGDFDSANQPPANSETPAPSNDYEANQLGGGSGAGSPPQGTETGATNPDGQPVATSTAVLESAEEFRNKRYPMTCQLYLDHNLIDSIPQSFIEALDRVQTSSIQLTQAPPQAALPSFLVEPPVHMRLDHLSPSADVGELSSALRPTTTTSPAVAAAIVDNGSASGNDVGSESAFGRRPLVPPDRKAALMEAMSQNVKLRQQQQQQQQLQPQIEVKWSVSPSLVALSLRHNNLARIDAKILDRLGKLIKSSNTQLYFGHNPFNCTDNQSPSPELLNASPMGDQLLAASDSSSGAYLEIAADDLIPSASGSDPTISGGPGQQNQQTAISGDNCPVGQFQRWLTINHGHIRDLDELYCVHMSPELVEKLRANNNNSLTSAGDSVAPANGGYAASVSSSSRKWEHDHPWASSLMLSTTTGGQQNGSQLEKNGVRWNSDQLVSMAKLINLNPTDLCPYSGRDQEALAAQLLSTSHQRALLGVAMIFMLISLCLLLMLIYFGDTQTMLAFVYIHMNPIYSCLRLNESHLDGDKLYDAFVSYSGADRDIVMELIERLEQQPELSGGGNGKGVAFAAGATGTLSSNPMIDNDGNATNGTLNRRTNSFQDLSTMSRSTPRLEFGGSALDVMGRDASGNNNNSNSKSAPYRLCIHERDWLPGHMISWNISNSVQNSRRTILIISKEFIKSLWFQVEFHTAYYQMLEDRIDRLIVIVRGELPPKKELDKDLAFLLTTKTYLTWGEKWFWERLHYALPHRSQPSGGLTKQMPASQPMKRHHHPHNNYGTTGNKHHQQHPSKKSSDLAASLSASADKNNGHNQKPLIMSSIGKDLVLPHHGTNQPAAMIGSSSSSGSATSNTRSSSSYLSGTSTGNLLSMTTAAANQPTMVTTTNSDLLTATTRLTIGPSATDSGHLGDSGRVTASLSGASLATISGQQPGGVTSIRLDGGQTTVTSSSSINTATTTAASSKARAKKQERLQNFVDKSISDQMHLSEL